MIEFSATMEILLCLLGAIVVGFIAGWLFTSYFIGLAAATGLFCWELDMLFSFNIEDDGYDGDIW